METPTTEPVAAGSMKSSPSPWKWAAGDQAVRQGQCTAPQPRDHLPEWSPVMERPMITISGDPSSRLKPMKPLARRTRRALRLSTPFLPGHKQQGSPSIPLPSLGHPVPCHPLPAVLLHQHPHQQGAHEPAQGKDGDGQGVEEGQGAGGQPVPIPLGPRGVVESLYVLQGQERHVGTKCAGRKGKTREDRHRRENAMGLTALQDMQGRM